MKLSDLRQAQADARKFMQKNDAQGIGFDAIVMMCYMTILYSGTHAVQSSSDQPDIGYSAATATNSTAPAWFIAALPPFYGKRATSSAILKSINRPTATPDIRAAGTWLRTLYGDPKRSNGQTVFDIAWRRPPPAEAGSKPALPMEQEHHDDENPYASGQDIESKATNFCAISRGVEVDTAMVCRAIGEQSNAENQKRVMAVLLAYGNPSSGGRVILGKS